MSSTLTPAQKLEDRSDYVKAAVIPCLVLSILGVSGRLLSRRLKKRGLDVSDYLIILGGACAVVESALVFAGKSSH